MKVLEDFPVWSSVLGALEAALLLSTTCVAQSAATPEKASDGRATKTQVRQELAIDPEDAKRKETAKDLLPLRIDNIVTQDSALHVDSSGRLANTDSYEIRSIPDNADDHSPHCAMGRVAVAGVTLNQRSKSNCVRICAGIPAGYELDSTRQIKDKVDHAYSAFFNPEYFVKARNVCLHFKNWSAHQCLGQHGSPCLRPRAELCRV